MRQDQYLKLQALSERLAEVAIVDADPSTWAGAGLTAGTMTQQQRGDAYWSRKMALSTISVLMRVDALIVQQQGPGTTPAAPQPPAPGEADEVPSLDAEINRYEKAAAVLMDTMARAGHKTAFDARTIRKG